MTESTRVRIIKIGPLYYFTTRLIGDWDRFVPPATEEMFFKLIPLADCFAILISCPSNKGLEEGTRAALQHVWDNLVSLNVVSGPLPKPIAGDPVTMLLAAAEAVSDEPAATGKELP